MNPFVKYTLGRLGLFVAVFLVLLPVPQLDILLKALLALVISFPLSWYLLRGWRDQVSVQVAGKLAARKSQKEQLRAALAGEDEPDGNKPQRGTGDQERDSR